MRGRFSQYDEDEYRLPEGMQRIAYDADTQQYTFRDISGRLYESAPGSQYGVLMPTSAPLPHRRNVTITEIPDPALRQVSDKPAKTFGDILPSGYITAAQPGASKSPTSMLPSREKWMQVAMPKVYSAVDVVRRRMTMKGQKPTGTGHGGDSWTGTGASPWGRTRAGTWGGARDVKRMGSLNEKQGLLEDKDDSDDTWEIIRRNEVVDGRLARSKSEMRSSKYAWCK